MKKIFLISAVVLFVVSAIWIAEQLEIDSCLDQGGKWTEENNTCEMN